MAVFFKCFSVYFQPSKNSKLINRNIPFRVNKFPAFSYDIVWVVDNLIHEHITITNSANPPSSLVQSHSDIHASSTDNAAKRRPRGDVCVSSRSARHVTGGVI